MEIKTYHTDEIKYNHHMGMECYDNKVYYPSKCIFLIDRGYGIKKGDTVKIERDEKGFSKRIWVNDLLVTEDAFKDIHGVSAS